MAIAYDPKDAIMVLPEGEYNAVLKTVSETESKKTGAPMFVLTWEVHPDDARPTCLVTDYIVMPKFTFKLKRLAISMGKLDDFEKQLFQPEDYIGSSAKVFLEVQKNDGYDDKNGIKSYVSPAVERERPWEKAAKSEPKPSFAPDNSVDPNLIPF